LIVTWRGLIHRAAGWFVRSRHLDEPAGDAAQRLAPAVAVLRRHIEPQLAQAPQVAAWVAARVPVALATRVAAAERLFSALDIAQIAEDAHCELEVAGTVYFATGERLGLEGLRQRIGALRTGNHWQYLAKVALADDLADLQRAIALSVLTAATGAAPERLQAWEQRSAAVIGRATRLLTELADAPSADLAMLSVALRELRQLA
jgi:glutamate dehydrogenase